MIKDLNFYEKLVTIINVILLMPALYLSSVCISGLREEHYNKSIGAVVEVNGDGGTGDPWGVAILVFVLPLCILFLAASTAMIMQVKYRWWYQLFIILYILDLVFLLFSGSGFAAIFIGVFYVVGICWLFSLIRYLVSRGVVCFNYFQHKK